MTNINPYSAFVKLRIGDVELTEIPPKHLRSFSYEKLVKDEYGSFTLGLYDNTAIEVESLLAQGFNQAQFMYGYVRGAVSNLYTMMISDYTLSFGQSGGVFLNLKGYSQGLIGAGIPRTQAFKEMKISDIVIDIANKEGWLIGKIEPTREVLVKDNQPQLTNANFIQGNQPSVNFIRNVLTPKAVSQSTGLGGYNLFFTERDGQVEVNFCTPQFAVSQEIKTYIWGIPHSDVVSVTPSYTGYTTYVNGGGALEATMVDSTTNETKVVSIDAASNEGNIVSGNRTNVPGDVKAAVPIQAGSEAEVTNQLASIRDATLHNLITVAMVIKGDPKFEPFSQVDLQVVLKNGVRHHSSGIYFVQKVVDEIKGGTYLTRVEMFRTGDTVGAYELPGKNLLENSLYSETPKKYASLLNNSKTLSDTYTEDAKYSKYLSDLN